MSAQAGFDAGDGARSYSLNGSGTEEILLLSETSNVGTPGLWLFRVDGNATIEPAGKNHRRM